MSDAKLSREETSRIADFGNRGFRTVATAVDDFLKTIPNEDEKNPHMIPYYIHVAIEVMESVLVVFSLKQELSKEELMNHLFENYDDIADWAGSLKNNKQKSNKKEGDNND